MNSFHQENYKFDYKQDAMFSALQKKLWVLNNIQLL